MSAEAPFPDGVLLVDKEAGWTSHDVVAKLRRLTGIRRIGHTGTLDPAATGLLVVCVGRATRLVEYMSGHDKRYKGAVALGVRTTTDDAQGELVERREVPPITVEMLRGIERRFSGGIEQLPPAYSAVKVDGRRAYAVARAGGTPALGPRLVQVHSLSVEMRELATIAIDVHCGPGTYIRSLARDIGEMLGCGAHLAALRRTSVGAFVVGQASTLSQLAALAERGRLQEVRLASDEGIRAMPAILVQAGQALSLAAGQPCSYRGATGSGRDARVYDAEGRFVGVGAATEGGFVRCRKVLLG